MSLSHRLIVLSNIRSQLKQYNGVWKQCCSLENWLNEPADILFDGVESVAGGEGRNEDVKDLYIRDVGKSKKAKKRSGG